MAERITTIYDLARYCRKNEYDCRRCMGYEYENCINRLIGNPDKANEKILKWCDEHPAKTYTDDFIEKFPNCKKLDGVPYGCRDIIYGTSHPECLNIMDCVECWNEAMPNEF